MTRKMQSRNNLLVVLFYNNGKFDWSLLIFCDRIMRVMELQPKLGLK